MRRNEENLVDPRDASNNLFDSIPPEHAFYVSLVDYLLPVFKVELEEAYHVKVASYSYFRGLLIIDGVLDGASKKQLLPKALSHIETSIKHLSHIFPLSHSFWNDFEDHKESYYKALMHEKEVSKTKINISQLDFEKLAMGKSAVCYAVIDALIYLSKEKPKTELLFKCLEYIHIAFQYQDDVNDFIEDLNNNQHTYAHALTNQSLEKEANVPQEISIDFLHRYFYISDNAEKMLLQSISQYEKAKNICAQYTMPALSNFILKEIDNCKNQILEINLLIEKTKTKSLLKNESVEHPKKLSIIEIEKTVYDGINYLLSCIDKENQLTDFLTTAGMAKSWVTSYSAFMLSDFKEADLLKQHFLKTNIFQNSLNASYNESILQDGDSMSFFVGSHKLLFGNVKDELINEWIKFKDTSGGWSTYLEEITLKKRLRLDENISVNGWLVPKNCISASTCNVLALFPQLKKEYFKTIEYLLKNRKSTGEVPSYWWSSPIYATAWTISALCKDESVKGESRSSIDWLLKQQNNVWGWNNAISKEESYFYTALALKALSEYDFEKYYDNIKNGVEYILRNQKIDGSWVSNRILAIPATDVIDPENVTKWRNSSFGVNIVVDDHRRIFTTVTVLNMLLQITKFIR